MFLSVDNSLAHRANGFNRIFTIGSLIRQHNHVSTLDYSISNVAYFSATWLWIINHTAHHLCRNDYQLAIFTTQGNDSTLYNWDDFRTSFHSQITASNHNTVASLNNFFQILWINGRLSLYLSNNTSRRAQVCQSTTQINNVISFLNKAQCNVIKILACAPLQIVNIFLSKNITAKIRIWQIQTLAAHQKAVVLDFYANCSWANDFSYNRPDFAVKHIEWLADFHLLRQIVLHWQVETAVMLSNF